MLSKNTHTNEEYVGPEEPMQSRPVPANVSAGTQQKNRYVTLCRLKEQAANSSSVDANAAYITALNTYIGVYGNNPFED